MTATQCRLVLNREDKAHARRDLSLLQSVHIAAAAAYHGKPVQSAFEKYAAALRAIIKPPTLRSHIAALKAKLLAWKSK